MLGTPEAPAHSWAALPFTPDGDGGEVQYEDQWSVTYTSLFTGKHIAAVHVA